MASESIVCISLLNSVRFRHFNLSQTIKNATEFYLVEFCCIFVNNEPV
jgi:hypothetical protein